MVISVASESIKLIIEVYQGLIKLPYEVRSNKMLKAANLVGKAISIFKITGLYNLSYVFTIYYGIPY